MSISFRYGKNQRCRMNAKRRTVFLSLIVCVLVFCLSLPPALQSEEAQVGETSLPDVRMEYPISYYLHVVQRASHCLTRQPAREV